MLYVFENSASVPVWTVFSVLLELTIALKKESLGQGKTETDICVWSFPLTHQFPVLKSIIWKSLSFHTYLVGLKKAIVIL